MMWERFVINKIPLLFYILCNLRVCAHVYMMCGSEVSRLSPDRGDEGRIGLLRELMEAYGNDVLRIVYGYVLDRQQAEDIGQEVFVKVYDHLDSFRGESSYRTWILRIAANHAKDYLRSSARRYVPVDDLSYVEGADCVEQTVVLQEEGEALWRAVRALPEIYRETLWLFYGQELTVDEIAYITQASTSSVKTRLYRGRELLRRDWGRGEEDGQRGRSRI